MMSSNATTNANAAIHRSSESTASSNTTTTTTTIETLSSTKRHTLSSLLAGSTTKVVSAVISSNPFPSGYHPLGYKLTKLGKIYLEFHGSNVSDVGLFLLTVKDGRRTIQSLKQEWKTIVRVTKRGDHMRILRKLPEIVQFCLSAGLVD